MKPITQCDVLHSQKARGVRDIALFGPKDGSTVVAQSTYIIHEDDLKGSMMPSGFLNKFCRPCPQTPQHGFVESRMIKEPSQFSEMVAQIKKTGEPVEIMVCPFVDAQWNAVVTPETVTIGLGNDGATSGKSLSYRTVFPTKLLTGGAKLTEGHPYVEVVYSQDLGMQVVQLRQGPEPPKTPDYIPEQVKVTTVYIAENQDLLEWQELIKNAPAGSCIYLNGKGWTSHYAVHGITKKLPVIASHEPSIGEVLSASAVYKPNTKDLARMAQYLAKAFQFPKIDSAEQIKECFAIFHHFGLWNTWTEAECKLMAYAIAVFPRITFSLGAGEMRHGAHKSGFPQRWSWIEGKGRSTVYTIADKLNMNTVASLYPWLVYDFRDGLSWSSGYGGMKWSIGAENGLNALKYAAKFMLAPNTKVWAQLVNEMNQMAYAVHNGGRYHNKVISEHEMNTISAIPGPTLFKEAYKLLYETF